MSVNSAKFRFYQELNDFLARKYRKKSFCYTFKNNPSIKDTIEAIGIPHTEVELILVNGKSVDFDYHLQNGDYVSVYPVFESLDISPIIKLHSKPLRITKFILDTQLGKLAKKLRMLGLDTLYKNSYKDKEIIKISREENRIILTRNKSLLKNNTVTHGYWIRNTDPDKQLQEIVRRFDLKGQIKPFTRCIECNGIMKPVNKKEIMDQLLPKTKKYYNEFYRCSHCNKIFWKGSHYQRMKKNINILVDQEISSDG